MYVNIIDSEALLENIDNPDWVIVDCRYDLMDSQAGREAWLIAHIPGAVYADVGKDLSGNAKDPAATDCGRHPLPSPQAMREMFSRLGIDAGKQVIVYDNIGGAFCARLWWMLKFMQHEAVAVLDGGWSAWQAINGPVRSGAETNEQTRFSGEPMHDRLVLLDQIAEVALLVDSRDPDRYLGKLEPIDPAAGHIPGAVNHFWQNNLDSDGRFLSGEKLAENFQGLLGSHSSQDAVFYCGSGVTACHNLLAMSCAGFEGARLYGGSWSEWCSDPQRPVATGQD